MAHTFFCVLMTRVDAERRPVARVVGLLGARGGEIFPSVIRASVWGKRGSIEGLNERALIAYANSYNFLCKIGDAVQDQSAGQTTTVHRPHIPPTYIPHILAS